MTSSFQTASTWQRVTRAARRLALAPLVALALPASAGVVFYAGFEAPTYSVGSVAGQAGWISNSGQVQATTVQSGAQALSLTGSTGFQFADHSLGHAISGGTYSLSTDINFDAPGQSGMALFGDTGTIAQLLWGAGGNHYSLHNHSANATPVPGLAGGWHHLEIVLDFTLMQMSGFVDGASIGSLAINNPVAPTSLMDLRLYSFDPGRTPVSFDNVQLQALSSPATTSLLLACLVVGALTRRRPSR